jgi:hypothetical protein
MSEKIRAVWSDEQVQSLNDYQASGVFHPYTCGNPECRADLLATPNGWVCPTAGCGYTQDWCLPFTADRSWEGKPA